MIFWQHAFNNGLIYIWQLYSHCRLKNANSLKKEFGLTIMQINSLITAIPKQWKIFFETYHTCQILPLRPHIAEQVINEKHLASHIYNHLISQISDEKIMNKKIKWDRELGTVTSMRQFYVCLNNIYKITNVSKYRSFQYRILHRAIITNKTLFKWDIIKSPLCVFCQKENETVIHLFIHCEKVKKIWDNITTWLKNEFNVQVKIDQENVIMNTVHDNPRNVANFICLLVKHYIYSQRCLGNPICTYEIMAKIKMTQNIEKYIAKRNNKLKIHEIKWSGK